MTRPYSLLLPVATALCFEDLAHLHQSIATRLQSELEKSTCPERKVACAIIGFRSYQFDILSIATNGAPLDTSNLPLSLHKKVCVHAEDRAVRNLPKYSDEYVLVSYSTLAPCHACSDKLLDARIRAHVYISDYDDMTGSEHLLDEHKPVYRLSSYGRLIPLDPDVRLSVALHYEEKD